MAVTWSIWWNVVVLNKARKVGKIKNKIKKNFASHCTKALAKNRLTLKLGIFEYSVIQKTILQSVAQCREITTSCEISGLVRVDTVRTLKMKGDEKDMVTSRNQSQRRLFTERCSHLQQSCWERAEEINSWSSSYLLLVFPIDKSN